jgi:adenosylcobinamide-GDP ribazoletransferase
VNLLAAFFTAFSMYSILPVPKAEWGPKSMKYAMCFFPLVGVAVGLFFFLWAQLSAFWGLGVFLRSAVCVFLPVLVSGGIHMDGFCDTTDALCSRQPAEKKLEILKDSHAGAFAVIGCTLYFLLSFGLWTELRLTKEAVCVLGIGFVLSRALSGLSVVTFRCAKSSGLVAAFSDAAAKRQVRLVLVCYLALCAAGLLFVHPLLGGAALLAAAAAFCIYRRVSYRGFGGTTGDLAGWFLQVCEFLMLLGVTAAQKLPQ